MVTAGLRTIDSLPCLYQPRKDSVRLSIPASFPTQHFIEVGLLCTVHVNSGSNHMGSIWCHLSLRASTTILGCKCSRSLRQRGKPLLVHEHYRCNARLGHMVFADACRGPTEAAISAEDSCRCCLQSRYIVSSLISNITSGSDSVISSCIAGLLRLCLVHHAAHHHQLSSKFLGTRLDTTDYTQKLEC